MNPNFTKFLVFAIFFLALFLVLGVHFYTSLQHQRYLTATSATLEAKIIPVVSQVDGTISALYINNNTLVKKGEPLFRLSPNNYKRDFDTASNTYNQLKQSIRSQTDAIIEAENAVESEQTDVSNISKNLFLAKNNGLGDTGLLRDDLEAAKEKLDQRFQKLQTAMDNYGPRGIAQTRLKAAQLAFEAAKAKMQMTYVTAPRDGYLIALQVKPNEQVGNHQELFKLIDHNQWTIRAHFRPYLYPHIQPNQMAVIKFDPNSNVVFQGRVRDISRQGVAIEILNPDSNYLLQNQYRPIVILDTQPSGT